jgi:MoaA/NifB/PqqE/SkfB family radical SAM enzyme
VKTDGLIKAAHQIDKIRYRPTLLWRISSGYVRALVLRQKPLRVIEFSINAACQSRCEYCYASKFPKPGRRLLSVEEIQEVWKQASALGAFSSFLLGGEPTLDPRFLDIVEVLEPRKNIVSFATNAITLTEEMIVELKRMGVFLIYVSLSSTDREVNDQVRGYDGHFDRAMEAIQLCKKHGLDVSLAITTSKSLLPETMRLLEFCRQEKLQANVNLVSPSGRAEDMADETFDEEFWAKLRELFIANPGLRGDWDVNLDLRVGCPAGYEKVHVAPYGDVTGCSIQPVSFGNVRETSLAEILRKMKTFRHFNKRSHRCIVAVDQEYIEDYVHFSWGQATTPYPVELNPSHTADLDVSEAPPDPDPPRA